MEKSQLRRRKEEQDTWSQGRKAESWGHPVGRQGKEQLCRQRGYADILGAGGSISENSTWTPQPLFRNPPPLTSPLTSLPRSNVFRSERLETTQLCVHGNRLKAIFYVHTNRTKQKHVN